MVNNPVARCGLVAFLLGISALWWWWFLHHAVFAWITAALAIVFFGLVVTIKNLDE